MISSATSPPGLVTGFAIPGRSAEAQTDLRSAGLARRVNLAVSLSPERLTGCSVGFEAKDLPIHAAWPPSSPMDVGIQRGRPLS